MKRGDDGGRRSSLTRQPTGTRGVFIGFRQAISVWTDHG